MKSPKCLERHLVSIQHLCAAYKVLLMFDDSYRGAF